MEEVVEVHSIGQSLVCENLLSKMQNVVDISDGIAKEIISEIQSSDLLVNFCRDHSGLNNVEKLCTKHCSVMLSHLQLN